MSRVSLKYHETFTISSNESNKSFSQYEAVLSSSNNLLAIMDSSNVMIFNASSKAMIAHFTLKTTSILFDINDKFIYLSDSYSLLKININNRNIQTIIEHDEKNNLIGSLTYSPDFKRIFFSNQSKLSSFSPYLALLNSSVINNPTVCPIHKFFIDPASQTLVSSSYDCKLCSFSIQTYDVRLKANNTIQQCRIGTVDFASSYALLTQETIITKVPQIILLNLQKLSIISHINQSSPNFSLNLLNLHNYVISYGRGDDHIWLYKDSITSKPTQISISQSILSMVYNEKLNEIYILMADEANSSYSLRSFGLAFNCSSIRNTINGSGQFEQKCSCKGGLLFDPSTQACSKLNCSNAQTSPCKCPYQQLFDDFTLKCNVDCSSIYNTYSSLSFGNPPQCSCNYPFEWNPTLSDCSYTDCSLINNTIPTNFTQRCTCQSTYVWNQSSISCQVNSTTPIISSESSGSAPVGLIIGLIFLFIVIAVSAVIFYVKKYRKSPQDLPKTFEYPPKYEQHNPTPRPLAFENGLKTSEELKQMEEESMKDRR